VVPAAAGVLAGFVLVWPAADDADDGDPADDDADPAAGNGLTLDWAA